MQVKYINKSMNGLINGHEYIVKVFEPKNKRYVYNVEFIFDCTEQEEMNLLYQYASMISLKRNFEFDKLELED